MSTIRKRLSSRLLLANLLLLALGSLGIYLFIRTALENQFDRSLIAKAEAIMTLTEQSGSKIKIEFSDEVMRSFDKNGSDFFEMFHENGKVIEKSSSLGRYHFPFIRDLKEDYPLFLNISFPDKTIIKTVVMKFRPQFDGDPKKNIKQENLILMVGAKRDQLDKTLATIQLILIGFCFLLLTVTTIVVRSLLRKELKPLQKLAENAANIDASNLSLRFPTDNLPEELLHISQRLNETFHRLEESFDRERRFSSYIAHELRTPLAELRAMIELIFKYPDSRSKEMEQEILEAIGQLELIIQKLLTLAKAERADLQVQMENVNLGELISDVWQSFKQKAEKRNLQFYSQIPSNCVIHTDPLLFKSILSNLIENSVEYALDGDIVRITVKATESGVQVEISNTVNNLTDSDILHLFDRFWRKDKARSPSSHIGIGLSLSKAMAKSLGYDLTATKDCDSRIVFKLSGIKTVQENKEN